MVRIYRVVHRKYGDVAYSGKGGLHADSRWTSRGQLVAYASESLALAALEKIAGAGRLIRLSDMVYVAADLRADGIHVAADLPDGWDRRPPSDASREIGDAWLRSGMTVALRVPSVVVPEGSNYVLNPEHPDFEEALNVHAVAPLRLDPRVLEQLRRD